MTVAQSVLMAFTVLTVRISSSAPFIWNTLVPAMQWCADLFVVYWLWQQQRVRPLPLLCNLEPNFVSNNPRLRVPPGSQAVLMLF